MKLSSHQEISLYERLLSYEPAPNFFEISPTIFKTMVGSFIDLLIEQQIVATLWIKLPKGEVWQAEIQRYCEAATKPVTIYVLGGSKNSATPIPDKTKPVSLIDEMVTVQQFGDGDDDPTIVRIPDAFLETVSQLPDTLTRSASGNAGSRATRISPTSAITNASISTGNVVKNVSHENGLEKINQQFIDIGQHLRREYFVLALSADFSGLLLSHRPRTKSSRSDTSMNVAANATANNAVNEELERKHPLLSICSFDPQLIRQVMQGVHESIQMTGQPQIDPDLAIIGMEDAPAPHPQQAVLAALQELLDNWDNLTALEIRQSLNPSVLSELFNRQIRNLEEVWHSSANFRRQAESLSVLQLANEELQNTLKTKDEFLKHVGQELRTPLSTMKTALKLLNSQTIKPNQRQRYMDMLEQECDRQSSLISSMLDLIQVETQTDSVPPQPVRVADVVPAVVSTYQPLAQEKGVLLAYHMPDSLPGVACSAQALRQIMINLLHNAVKFTNPGGRVWVRFKPLLDQVQIEIEDTGVGIAASDIPRIFERFYKVRHGGTEEVYGAGLGLAIVQQLLLQVGGSISVKSEPGEGSTFIVLLPVYKQ